MPALEVSDSLLLKWRASEANFHSAANALRYHQGRVFGARLSAIPFGERSAFKDEMGGLLQLSRRSVELRIQIATEINLLLDQAGDDATELRRSVLDRPWRDVLAAVRRELHGPSSEEDEFSISPDDPPRVAEVPPVWHRWQTQLQDIEEESFDTIPELDEWVRVLREALQRAIMRRHDLEDDHDDEVLEMPAAG